MADQKCTSKQIAGVLGLLFTKAYLAYSHFQNYNTKHITFKMNLANELMSYRMEQCFPLSLSTDNIATADIQDTKVCVLVLLEKPSNGKVGRERAFQRYQKLTLIQSKGEARKEEIKLSLKGKCWYQFIHFANQALVDIAFKCSNTRYKTSRVHCSLDHDSFCYSIAYKL